MDLGNLATLSHVATVGSDRRLGDGRGWMWEGMEQTRGKTGAPGGLMTSCGMTSI